MMSKISYLRLRDLQNYVHSSFHAAGVSYFTEAATSEAMLTPYFTRWRAAFEHEDQALQAMRKSADLLEAHTYNKVRYNCLAAIRSAIRTHASCPQSPVYNQALDAHNVFNKNKTRMNNNIDRLSSIIYHLAAYCSTPEMVPFLRFIGMTEIFASMQEADQKVLEALARHDEVSTMHPTGEVVAARRQCDQTYQQFIQALRSLQYLHPGRFDDLAEGWNQTVVRYRTALRIRQAVAASARNEAAATEDAENTTRSENNTKEAIQIASNSDMNSRK